MYLREYWVAYKKPEKDAVIVELIDGRFATHIECLNKDNQQALINMANYIIRQCIINN